MPKYDFGPQRRRRSPIPMVLITLVVLVIGFLVFLSTQRIEQDVTNEVLAK